MRAVFAVALDPFDRIGLAHAPLDGERKHLGQQRNGAVGGVGRAALGDLAVEGVDVLESDIGHLGVLAEVRLDVQLQQVAVFEGGAGALLRKVLRPEALDQVEHSGRGALVLDVTERVAAVLNLTPKFARPVTGLRRPPHRSIADGERALPSRPGRVSQDEPAVRISGDAGTEAGNVGIDGDGLALLGKWKPPHDGVGEAFSLSHEKSLSPSYARQSDDMPCPGM